MLRGHLSLHGSFSESLFACVMWSWQLRGLRRASAAKSAFPPLRRVMLTVMDQITAKKIRWLIVSAAWLLRAMFEDFLMKPKTCPIRSETCHWMSDWFRMVFADQWYYPQEGRIKWIIKPENEIETGVWG